MTKNKALTIIQSPGQTQDSIYLALNHLIRLKRVSVFSFQSPYKISEKVSSNKLCDELIFLNRHLINRQAGFFIPPTIKEFTERTLQTILTNPYFWHQAAAARALLCNPLEPFKINGALNLSGFPITSLPENIKIGGYLDISMCTGITSLPANIQIAGSLALYGTSITSLPDNLTIGGDLYLWDMKNIKFLPINLKIGGHLDLYGTGITSLPNDIQVIGEINGLNLL